MVKRWVMDCSLAAALGLPDERSDLAEAFLRGMAECEVWVPVLWWHEIGNVILTARRRGRISEADAIGLFSLYEAMPLRTDAACGEGFLERIHHLALMHGLSAYDAAYLELAQRRRAGLATLDAGLRSAAQECGIVVFGA